ncbi:MAG: cation:proton antiporter, partial [Acidimicrobiales bacterium]
LAVWLFINDISWWEAALVGAILAPTDAALGQEVVSDPAVPVRIRQGLNVESGPTDGLVAPAVSLFVVLASGEENAGSAAFWVRFLLRQVGVAVLVGVAVGVAGAWLLAWADARGWADGIYSQLATLAVAIAAYTVALEFEGNGFIAAFVAGLLFGRVSPDPARLGEYTEDTAALAASVSFFLFGNILLGPALDTVTFSVLACAVFILTLGRMVPVATAMARTGAARPTVLFVGWFGPRGLASILFGLIVLEEQLASAQQLFGIVAWTVVLSVILHGATAAWGARRYGQWWAEMSSDERDSMHEGVEVAEHRTRWHRILDE